MGPEGRRYTSTSFTQLLASGAPVGRLGATHLWLDRCCPPAPRPPAATPGWPGWTWWRRRPRCRHPPCLQVGQKGHWQSLSACTAHASLAEARADLPLMLRLGRVGCCAARMLCTKSAAAGGSKRMQGADDRCAKPYHNSPPRRTRWQRCTSHRPRAQTPCPSRCARRLQGSYGL